MVHPRSTEIPPLRRQNKRKLKGFPLLKAMVDEILEVKDEEKQAALLKRALWESSETVYLDVKGHKYTEANKYALSSEEKDMLARWTYYHPVTVEWQYTTKHYSFLSSAICFWDFLPEDIPSLLKNKKALREWQFLFTLFEENPDTTRLLFSHIGEGELTEKGVFVELLRRTERYMNTESEYRDYWLSVSQAACHRVREIWGIDNDIPDSWVVHLVLNGQD